MGDCNQYQGVQPLRMLDWRLNKPIRCPACNQQPFHHDPLFTHNVQKALMATVHHRLQPATNFAATWFLEYFQDAGGEEVDGRNVEKTPSSSNYWI
ncbi:hypothetical protein RB195_013780 [Necator americanus]|uniref:Uncharacterized protein n=1 Tax=Necator americanus TaxID=51031 RepID=A0ABR1DX53_NECAM